MKEFIVGDLVSFHIETKLWIGYVIQKSKANNYLIELTPYNKQWIAGDMLTLESRA